MTPLSQPSSPAPAATAMAVGHPVHPMHPVPSALPPPAAPGRTSAALQTPQHPAPESAPHAQRNNAWLAPWNKAEHQVDLALVDLRHAVRAACATQPDREEIEAALDNAIRDIQTGLRTFAEGLADSSRTSGRDAPAVARLSPRDLLDDARQRVRHDELMHMMDHNGFAELRLSDILLDALDDMTRLMDAAPPAPT